MKINSSIFYAFILYAAFGYLNSMAIAGDGIEWERFRLIPILTVSESYTDNLYRVERNKTDDYITTVTPEMTFDIAIVPKNYFSLKYIGDFHSHSNADNFKKDHHRSSLSFNSETAKGSHLEAGVSAQETAIQPYSEQEESKTYALKSAYADILAKLGKVTEVGTHYNRQEREFYQQEFSDDDFSRDTWDLHMLYSRSSIWPLLMQYQYMHQDNNDVGLINSDFHTHTIYLGGRWREDKKISGAIKVGYKWAEFGRSEQYDYYGYTADIDLTYEFSEFTKITYTAQSTIGSPTRSDRESGEYYENKSFGLSITHRRWERIITRLYFLYRLRNYKEIQRAESIRKDDYYRAGWSISYVMRRWIRFTLGYRYHENNSDIANQDYSENRITFDITLSM